MTNSIQLKGFKDDTWLNGIGDLFCKTDSVRWGVNLSIYPGKETGSDSTSLSNAPLLVRKNIINPTKDYYPNVHEQSFEIFATRDWDVVQLKSCPALERPLPKELFQYCFEFSIEEGIRVFLPQFELARALFFHNAYLARSSVLHDVLSNEFIVEAEPKFNWAHIHVLDTCNYSMIMAFEGILLGYCWMRKLGSHTRVSAGINFCMELIPATIDAGHFSLIHRRFKV